MGLAFSSDPGLLPAGFSVQDSLKQFGLCTNQAIEPAGGPESSASLCQRRLVSRCWLHLPGGRTAAM